MQNALIEVNSRHTGTIVEIKPFGAIVKFGKRSGLLHISECSGGSFVARGRRLKALQVGMELPVVVIRQPEKKGKKLKIALSERQPQNERVLAELAVGTVVEAEVAAVREFGAICTILEGPAADFDGLYHIGQVPGKTVDERKAALAALQPGQRIKLAVNKVLIDAEDLRIGLSLKLLLQQQREAAAKQTVLAS